MPNAENENFVLVSFDGKLGKIDEKNGMYKKLGISRVNINIPDPHPKIGDKVETQLGMINMYSGKQGGVISFETLGDSLNEQMRITKTGVGIRTTNPISELDIVGKISLRDSPALTGLVHGKIKKENILLDGYNGDITLRSQLNVGSNDNRGIISVKNGNGNQTINLDGNRGDIHLNKDGIGTDNIYLDGYNGDITLRSQLNVGSNRNRGMISVLNGNGDETINIDGNRGDIHVKGDVLLEGADCAEEFDIAIEEVEEGTVMVVNRKGKLQPCQKSYDKSVAGVISGAGDYKPGIILDKQTSYGNRQPIALVGKTYCKVDAKKSPIEVGDLLTTSKRTGHAMKANDPYKAFGSVIGKALNPLKEGQGMIPILISLQ